MPNCISRFDASKLHLATSTPAGLPTTAKMSEEPRKRSRFDQTESDAPRKSRFDRRSRSPSAKDAEPSRRSRSPILSPGSAESKRDAASAAAAAAAKINATLSAKKGAQEVDVPPIRAVREGSGERGVSAGADSNMQNASPSADAGAIKSPGENKTSGTLNDEIYQQDGDYIRDIEVNDLRNRYTLTKGSTQKMVNTTDHPTTALLLFLLARASLLCMGLSLWHV